MKNMSSGKKSQLSQVQGKDEPKYPIYPEIKESKVGGFGASLGEEHLDRDLLVFVGFGEMEAEVLMVESEKRGHPLGANDMGAERNPLRESSNNSLPREEKKVTCVTAALLNISKALLNCIDTKTRPKGSGMDNEPDLRRLPNGQAHMQRDPLEERSSASVDMQTNKGGDVPNPSN